MFEFFRGIASAISEKARKNDQVLFSTDTGELQFDIAENGITNRYSVKDPLAQSLDGKTILIL